jgi:pimeloyl-ACP methyl ester carboxylesterase
MACKPIFPLKSLMMLRSATVAGRHSRKDGKLPIVDLNGARIYFTDTGGEKEVILFSHGLLLSGAMFEKQIAHFQGQYRCIAFDHRGQGRSGVTEDGYDLETLTEDAAALIEHLGAAPCHFVGLSMGGMVGMRLAARRPELLKTLTLLDTSADPEAAENGPKYRMLNLVARWIGLWAVVGRVMPILFGQTFLRDAARVEERKQWSKAISVNHRIGITRAVTGLIEREGCSDLLSEIRIPVSIGVGNEDVATEPRKSEKIHAAIKGSELVVFKRTGHSSSIEAPESVNNLIERTIKREG